MPKKNTLQQDMLKLAKTAYDMSVKHGGIYISVSKIKESCIAWTTYGDGLEDVDYRPNKKTEDKNENS